jgi:hypothetical protein
MNNRQNAKLNMAQRVANTMESYKPSYETIAPVTATVAELNTNIEDIREAEKEQDAVRIPVFTQEKHKSEGQMVDACVKVSNVLHVIGFVNDNKVLTNLVGLSPNDFYRGEDNTKLSLARRILDLSKEYSSELLNYGYTLETIADIGTKIDSYQRLISKPMEAAGARKQKTASLQQRFATLDSTLYDKLDKLIVLFKDTHPDFYNEYRTARNLIDTSARHKKSTEPQAD